MAGKVDKAARDAIVAAGYGSCFLSHIGHGIDIADHEAPFAKERNPVVLREGMASSVEPAIYLAGRFWMRVEDTVVIDGGKVEVLNTSPRGIMVVWHLWRDADVMSVNGKLLQDSRHYLPCSRRRTSRAEEAR